LSVVTGMSLALLQRTPTKCWTASALSDHLARWEQDSCAIIFTLLPDPRRQYDDSGFDDRYRLALDLDIDLEVTLSTILHCHTVS